MKPTSEDFAIAITAACRETGEDPIRVAEDSIKRPRARHYAIHALKAVFPDADGVFLAQFTGHPRPTNFWPASRGQVRGVALWWNDDTFVRIIRAIEADRWRRGIAAGPMVQVNSYVDPPAYPSEKPSAARTEVLTEAPLPKPRPFRQGPGRLEPDGYRPPAGTIDAVLTEDRGPIFDRGQWATKKAPEPVSKADLYAELARAAANTKPRADE